MLFAWPEIGYNIPDPGQFLHPVCQVPASIGIPVDVSGLEEFLEVSDPVFLWVDGAVSSLWSFLLVLCSLFSAALFGLLLAHTIRFLDLLYTLADRGSVPVGPEGNLSKGSDLAVYSLIEVMRSSLGWSVVSPGLAWSAPDVFP